MSRLGGLAGRTSRKFTQQENQVRDVKGALDRAKRARELVEGEARKLREELVDQERRLKLSEEALVRARADAQVRVVDMQRWNDGMIS